MGMVYCAADFQRLVRIIARQGIEEALYIVTRRADVIAGRDHLLAVRLLTCPLTRFYDRQLRASSLQQAGAASRIWLGNMLCDGSDFERGLKEANLHMGTRGGRQIPTFEAEMLQRGSRTVEREAEHFADCSGERGIDDGHAASTEVVVARNRGRIHGRDSVTGKLLRKFVR